MPSVNLGFVDDMAKSMLAAGKDIVEVVKRLREIHDKLPEGQVEERRALKDMILKLSESASSLATSTTSSNTSIQKILKK